MSEELSRVEDLLENGVEEPVLPMSELEAILRGEKIKPHSRVAELLLQYNPQDILIEKSITENGTYYASVDNADGYFKVIVDTPVVPPTVLDHLVETITENGEYTYTPEHDGYSDAAITVSVPKPQPVVASKTVTENDTYVAADEQLDGYSQVVVNVPPTPLDTMNITHNGTYHPPTGRGFDEVNVAVPLGTKTITENGTYVATDDNLDGYSSVDVDVPQIGIKDIPNTPTPIASFSDGAEDLPLKSLTASIEPLIGGNNNPPSSENIKPMSGHTSMQIVDMALPANYQPSSDGKIHLAWNDGSTNYDMPFNVCQTETVKDSNNNDVDVCDIESEYVLPFDCVYDEPEAIIAGDTDLPAGNYYFKIVNDVWGGNNNKYVSFTLSETLTAGQQIRKKSGGYNASIESCTLGIFTSGADRTGTELAFTISTSQPSSGTDLGQTDGSGNLNHWHCVVLGYNRWKFSAVRQFLNSANAKGSWWTQQHKWDVKPAYADSKDGFLYGFNSNLLADMKETKVVTARNSVFNSGETPLGGFDETYDKVFLISLEQSYINPQISGEGEYWEYYKRLLGRTTPASNGVTYARLIKYDLAVQTTARFRWLRSANRSYAYHVWYVSTSGNVYSNTATYGYGLAPCLRIGLSALNKYTVNFKDESNNPLTVVGGQLNINNGQASVDVYPYYDSYNGEILTGEWISDRDVYTEGGTPTTGAQVLNIGGTPTTYTLDDVSISSHEGINNVFASTGDVLSGQYFGYVYPELGTKTITENGTYDPADDSLDGYSGVTVTIPLGTKTITENGTYVATDDNLDGYSQVTINVAGGGGETKYYEYIRALNGQVIVRVEYPDAERTYAKQTLWFFNGYYTDGGDKPIPANLFPYLPVGWSTDVMMTSGYSDSTSETQIGWVGFLYPNRRDPEYTKFRTWTENKGSTLAGTFWGVLDIDGEETQIKEWFDPYENVPPSQIKNYGGTIIDGYNLNTNLKALGNVYHDSAMSYEIDNDSFDITWDERGAYIGFSFNGDVDLKASDIQRISYKINFGTCYDNANNQNIRPFVIGVTDTIRTTPSTGIYFDPSNVDQYFTKYKMYYKDVCNTTVEDYVDISDIEGPCYLFIVATGWIASITDLSMVSNSTPQIGTTLSQFNFFNYRNENSQNNRIDPIDTESFDVYWSGGINIGHCLTGAIPLSGKKQLDIDMDYIGENYQHNSSTHTRNHRLAIVVTDTKVTGYVNLDNLERDNHILAIREWDGNDVYGQSIHTSIDLSNIPGEYYINYQLPGFNINGFKARLYPTNAILPKYPNKVILNNKPIQNDQGNWITYNFDTPLTVGKSYLIMWSSGKSVDTYPFATAFTLVNSSENVSLTAHGVTATLSVSATSLVGTYSNDYDTRLRHINLLEIPSIFSDGLIY